MTEQEMLDHPLLKGKFYMAVGASQDEDVSNWERTIRVAMLAHRTDTNSKQLSVAQKRKYRTAEEMAAHYEAVDNAKKAEWTRKSSIMTAYAELIAKVHRVPYRLVVGDARDEKSSMARHHLVYAVRKNHPEIKLGNIGKFLKRDHTTVMYGLRKIERYQSKIQSLLDKVDERSGEIVQQFSKTPNI